ncbi:MAG: twin-arginine translocase TatA/TatE family subunit [Gemmatimonadaceae bacterium]
MFGMGPEKILLLLVVCLLLFGAKRLPEIGHSLGKGIREFKGSLSDAADPPPDRDRDRRSELASRPEAPPPSPVRSDDAAPEPKRLLS